jgi:hypothetical protein
MNSIIDHGEQDNLTPKFANLTEVDHAIARVIRKQISQTQLETPSSFYQQLQRNGLAGRTLEGWLQS